MTCFFFDVGVDFTNWCIILILKSNDICFIIVETKAHNSKVNTFTVTELMKCECHSFRQSYVRHIFTIETFYTIQGSRCTRFAVDWSVLNENRIMMNKCLQTFTFRWELWIPNSTSNNILFIYCR